MKNIKILLGLIICLFAYTYAAGNISSAALSTEQEYEQSYLSYTMSEYMKKAEWMNLLNTSLESTRVYPDNPIGYFYMGIALDELGKHEEAIKAYNKVLELTNNQKNEYLYQARGLANYKAGHYKAAMRDYNTSISTSPTLRALYQRELTRFAIRREKNGNTATKPKKSSETKKDCSQVL